MTSVTEGGLVLLYFDVRRQWLLRVERGKEFHTHKGFIRTDEIVGLPFGSEIKSSLGERFWLLKPTTHDFIMHSLRRTQIMYPKDIGLILLKLSLTSGMKVLEVGTGSGAMTVAAATAIKPTGHVHTYEVRNEFADLAERNLRRASVADYVTVHRADARNGIDGNEFDAAIIDVGDPWPLIPLIHEALSGGAALLSFSPTVNQVEKTTETLGRVGFVNVHTLECFIREIRADTGKTRPATMMIGHTGYMTFGQKVMRPQPNVKSAAEPNSAQPSEVAV